MGISCGTSGPLGGGKIPVVPQVPSEAAQVLWKIPVVPQVFSPDSKKPKCN